MLIKRKKAQVWGIDLLVALIIFIVGLLVVYFYAVNYRSVTSDVFNDLSYQADLASSLLLSEDDFGILENGKVDQIRLEAFNSLSDSEKKSSIGVVDNFYINMTNLEISGSPVSYIGIMNSSEVFDMSRVTRIVIYKDKPTKFEIIFWR